MRGQRDPTLTRHDPGVIMKCNAAVLHGTRQDRTVEKIEVDGPKVGEVLVRGTRAGMSYRGHPTRCSRDMGDQATRNGEMIRGVGGNGS